MSYSIFPDDVVDVDSLVDKIRLYARNFSEYDKAFSHYKNVERFQDNLESRVPDSADQITEIYCSGRDLAFSIHSHIYECLTAERTSLLKTGIDRLECQLIGLKDWAKSEHDKVSAVYQASGHNEWSVNKMLSQTIEMCQQIGEILTLVEIIKSSYTYKIQSGQITVAEIRESRKVKMNTVNNLGNFQNSQITSGDNNTNTMTVNQANNEELAAICQKLIKIIDQSEGRPEEKEAVKTVVYEIKNAEKQTDLKEAYSKLISSISAHITIGTAILESNILPILNSLIS